MYLINKFGESCYLTASITNREVYVWGGVTVQNALPLSPFDVTSSHPPTNTPSGGKGGIEGKGDKVGEGDRLGVLHRNPSSYRGIHARQIKNCLTNTARERQGVWAKWMSFINFITNTLQFYA